MNKEDIWVSRIPLPVRSSIKRDIHDDFEDLIPDGVISDWNIYAPLWAPIAVIKEENNNACLQLSDKDPYDYARAIRIFEENRKVKMGLRVKAKKINNGVLEIDVTDQFGNRPVQLIFEKDGTIQIVDGNKKSVLQKYTENRWYQIELEIEATPYGNFSLTIDGNEVVKKAALALAVRSVERLSFRTGSYRDIPNRKTPNEDPHPPLTGADFPVEEAIFLVDDVWVKK
jgi:hypothetical protein